MFGAAQKSALALSYLFCVCHGRRVRSSSDKVQNSQHLQEMRAAPSSGALVAISHLNRQVDDRGWPNPLKSLLRLLLAIDPALAFNPFGLGAGCTCRKGHHPRINWQETDKKLVTDDLKLEIMRLIEEDEAFRSRETRQQAPASVFRVEAEYNPSGDQPTAIKQLVERLRAGSKFQVLRGATGTGKTFVIAHAIAQLNKPALVLCHNKVLAAQLVRELKGYLPDAAVELFVSYYNYYRPEAYLPAADKYLQKQSSINSELDAMRHRATKALFERRDVVVVASVSCIYGIGLPKKYLEACIEIFRGDRCDLEELVGELKDNLYTEQALLVANDEPKKTNSTTELSERGTYMVRQHAEYTEVFVWPPSEVRPLCVIIVNGYVVAILRAPSSAAETSSSGEGSHIVAELGESAAASGEADGGEQPSEPEHLDEIRIYPARHHVSSREELEEICDNIVRECEERIHELLAMGKQKEADRLRERVANDVTLIRQTGTCPGVENYSRHFAGRQPGAPPDTLLDYFSLPERGGSGDSTVDLKDWLLIADESHVSLPQLQAMYAGDRKRKNTLVEYGFRLPSALDNRPLKAPEFWKQVPQGIFVSATPGTFELDRSARTSIGPPAEMAGQELLSSGGNVVEMTIRPTYVLDPVVEVRSTQGQLQSLLGAIRNVSSKGQKALVVAISRRDAEDLARWLTENGVNATYMHCELTTPQRTDVLRALQRDKLEVVVGVNLLREGLDLPEVSLVAIMNADKEGFLRNDCSLIQAIGRAARNVDGHAILFADRVTPAMQRCIRETARRREMQQRFNEANGVSPRSTQGREVRSLFDITREQLGVDEIQGSVAWSRKGYNITRGNSAGNAGSIAEASTGARKRVTPSPTYSAKTLLRDGETLDEVMPHVAGLRDMVSMLPRAPGVYYWKTGPHKGDKVLYVGKAKNLRQRTSSYLRGNTLAEGSRRIFKMIANARHIEVELAENEHAALLLEARRIKELRPIYNVLLRDDSFYPYICVDRSVSPPDVGKAWRLSEHEPGKRYYGPYTNSRELQGILDNIQELFGLRQQRFEVRYGDGDLLAYEQSISDCEEMLAGRGQDLAQHRSITSAAQQNAFDSLQDRLGRRRELSFVGGDPAAPARDVAAAVMSRELAPSEPLRAAVHILQLRGDKILNKFTYIEDIEDEQEDMDEDAQEELLRRCLEQHYMRCTPEQIPDTVITQPALTLLSKRSLRDVLQHQRCHKEPLACDSNAGVTGSIQQGKITVREPRRSNRKGAVEERRVAGLAAANAEAELQRFLDSETQRLEALDDLQRALRLQRTPRRIEAYDISHLGGEQTVASRIVFRNGKPAKHLYRKYHIRSLEEGEIDDFKSMHEVIGRRFRAGTALASLTADEDDALPDVVLVDGGKGQLSAALQALRSVGIAPYSSANSDMARDGHLLLCSLAKREEDVFLPDSPDPLNIKKDSPALRLLMSARDESHRFASSFHRQRRAKKLLSR
mmetsp:Transcript_118090/g.217309  ORF Transcript_118090/g.217309 Transcript_118090/m.217309 type:complete len:1482 (+) Transcript_118090:44-4489(+)